MFCKKCGTQVPDNATACPKCGTSSAGAGAQSGSANLKGIGGIVERVVDGVLAKIRVLLSQPLYTRLTDFLTMIGHVALVGAIAWTLIMGIVFAAHDNSFNQFLRALAAALGLVVAQFIAAKFIRTSAALISTTPTQISTLAFPDCVGLLSLIGAVGALVAGIVMAIQMETLTPLWGALILSFLLTCLGWLSLQPSLANINVAAGSSTAEEAIAVLGYFAKMSLKLVPVMFGGGVVVGTLALVLASRALMNQYPDWYTPKCCPRLRTASCWPPHWRHL